MTRQKEYQNNNAYHLLSESTKTINGVDVSVQHLIKDNMYYHDYFFTLNDVNYAVLYATTNSKWNDTDPTEDVNVVMISLINSFDNPDMARGYDAENQKVTGQEIILMMSGMKYYVKMINYNH